MKTRVLIAVLLMAASGLEGCQLLDRGPYLPDLGGVYTANDAFPDEIEKTADEIVESFDQADEAVDRADVDAIMSMYSKTYRHRGFDKDRIAMTWKDLYKEYRHLSLTLIFNKITVDMNSTPPKAQVVSTGTLWGTTSRTGRHIHIDSWFDEIYYLVYEDGRWRAQGHAWEFTLDKETRFARPPRPFF